MSTATSPREITVGPRAAWENPAFRLYEVARFLATVGIQIQAVSVGKHVYDMTQQPLALGFVGLSTFLPAILLSPVTGAVADRFDRQRVLMWCHAGFAACGALLAAFAVAGWSDVRLVYAILALWGVPRAFSGPAASALLPGIVPPEHLANAITWNSTTWQLAAMTGPALGGALYAMGGAPLAYGVATACGVGALVALSAVQARPFQPEKRAITPAVLLEGLRFVRARKVVLGAMSLDLFAVLLGGATALLPVYADDVLHVGPWGLGVLRAAPSVGATVTAMLLARLPIRRRAGLTMFGSVALFGVCTVVFGLSTSFPLSLLALVGLGAFDMVSVVVRQTLIQLATPNAMRGRVSAVNMVFVGASNELGEFESGIVAAAIGAVPAVVVGGLGTLAIVGVWSLLFPDLRKVDRLDALAPPSDTASSGEKAA